MIVPDPAVDVRVDFADDLAPEHFFLGDICTTDGNEWEVLPTVLRRALADLHATAGLRLVAAFAVAPAPALTASDHAVITREIARATALRLGHRPLFSAMPGPERAGRRAYPHES